MTKYGHNQQHYGYESIPSSIGSIITSFCFLLRPLQSEFAPGLLLLLPTTTTTGMGPLPPLLIVSITHCCWCCCYWSSCVWYFHPSCVLLRFLVVVVFRVLPVCSYYAIDVDSTYHFFFSTRNNACNSPLKN